MSTPTSAHDTDRVGTAAVPQPRRPSDPPLPATAERPPAARPAPEEPVGLFGRFVWLTPAAGVACTVVLFVAMIALTWVAGGLTPFSE